MPRRWATPGRELSRKMSAVPASRWIRAKPSALFMSTIKLRLPMLAVKLTQELPALLTPIPRPQSPVGVSILITSAPYMASSAAADGAAKPWLQSTTRSPA